MKSSRRIIVAAVTVALGAAGAMPAFASGSHHRDGSLVSVNAQNNGEVVSVDQPSILNGNSLMTGDILSGITTGNVLSDILSGNTILSGNSLEDVASHNFESALDDITVKNFLNGFEVEHIADNTLQSGLDDGVVTVGEGVSVDSVNADVSNITTDVAADVDTIVKNNTVKALLDTDVLANLLGGRL